MVGLFFYIESPQLDYKGFITHTVAENKAEIYGDMLTDSVGHSQVFESRFPDTLIEYYDFPRGRIVYDTKNGKYIIYIDKCIRTVAKIRKIKEIFGILDKRCEIQGDFHYVCKKCHGKI